MNNRPGRTPSPGHPVNQGYQLEDTGPYGRPGGSPGPGRHNLEIPMGPGRHTPSDRLQAQPTVSLYSDQQQKNLR
jgi:chitin synthase